MKTQIEKALKKVIDPELGVSVLDLGLIYDIQVAVGGLVNIKMTTTTPMCPLINLLVQEVEEAVRSVDNVQEVKVELVWEPAWSPDKMTKEARLQLGFTSSLNNNQETK